MVTVAVPSSHHHHAGVSIEEREGTNGRNFPLPRRGRLSECGHDLPPTHKPVKRIIKRRRGRRTRRSRKRTGARNYDEVAEVGRSGSRRRRGGSRPSGCWSRPERSAMSGRRGTSGGWSLTEKKQWRQRTPRGRRPAVWTPGDTVVIDWGILDGAARVLRGVGLVEDPVRPVRRATRRPRPRWRCWPSASRTLGGVPQGVLADRMGCLKGGDGRRRGRSRPRTTCGSPRITGFRPDFCQAADPASKGIVENLVGYAKTT